MDSLLRAFLGVETTSVGNPRGPGTQHDASADPRSVPGLDGISTKDLAAALASRLNREVAVLGTEQLKEYEDTLHFTLSGVRRVINARKAICRLPVELLAEIMVHIPKKLPGLPEEPWTTDARDVRDLIPLTHTCHHIRRVALCYPSIWSTVLDDESPRNVALTGRATRSKALEAVMKGHVTPARQFALVENASHRIRGLQWAPDFSAGPRAPVPILRFVQFAAPSLESFSLVHPGGDEGMSGLETSLTTFFRGDAPRLQRMFLQAFPFLPENRFQSLTHLGLSHLALATGLPERLFKIIGMCPNIESLFLREITQSLQTFLALGALVLDESALNPIYPPRLKRFTLISNHAILTQLLLSHIHCIESGRVIQVLPAPEPARDILYPLIGSVRRVQLSALGEPNFSVALTAVGTKSVVRLTMAQEPAWLSRTLQGLHHDDGELPELWLRDTQRILFLYAGVGEDAPMSDPEDDDDAASEPPTDLLRSIADGVKWARVIGKLVIMDEHRLEPAVYLRILSPSEGEEVGLEVRLLRVIYVEGLPEWDEEMLVDLLERYESLRRDRGYVLREVELVVPPNTSPEISDPMMDQLQAAFTFRIVEFDSVPRMDIPEEFLDPYARRSSMASLI